MFDIQGKYVIATVSADMIDSDSYAQILRMCNTEKLKSNSIKMMPDAHASKGCTVGTSLTYDKYVNPSYVGDDIGCGMQVYMLEEESMNLYKLDETIHNCIPYTIVFIQVQVYMNMHCPEYERFHLNP